jgi:hypothetical protein
MPVRSHCLIFLGILLAGCAAGPSPTSLPVPTLTPQIRSAAEALRAAVDGDLPLDALTIDYRVGSEAWGGATSLLIQGPGNAELTFSLEGEHTTWSATLTERDFLDLCRLLVEHEVWAIRGEREEGIPDEAYPNVTISAEGYGSFTAGMWDGEAAEHPHYGPIVRELDSLAYHIKIGAPE